MADSKRGQRIVETSRSLPLSLLRKVSYKIIRFIYPPFAYEESASFEPEPNLWYLLAAFLSFVVLVRIIYMYIRKMLAAKQRTRLRMLESQFVPDIDPFDPTYVEDDASGDTEKREQDSKIDAAFEHMLNKEIVTKNHAKSPMYANVTQRKRKLAPSNI